MKTRNSGAISRAALIVVALLAFAGVASLAIYVRNTPKLEFSELKPERRTAPIKGNSVSVPVPKIDGSQNVSFESEPAKVPKGEDPVLFAVNEFLKHMRGSAIAAEHVRIDHKVAMIDFPAGTVFSFGSEEEATFLNGLRSAIGQFAAIDAVELYVGGQRVDELGHIEISDPLPVIRPDRWKAPTKPSAGSEEQESN